MGLAIIIHAGLLINYKQTYTHSSEQVKSQEVIIGLKKLKTPTIVQPKTIEVVAPVSKPVTPVKPIPVIKKPKTAQSKPVIKKPTLIKKEFSVPNIAPALEREKNIDPVAKSSKPSRKSIASQDNAINLAKKIEDEKARYYIKLAKWLEKHKKYPTIARRRNQQGDVLIKFVIDAQGKLLSHVLVKPSDHRSLNSATIKMLERASPMPALPAVLVKGKQKFEYTIPVRFELSNAN